MKSAKPGIEFSASILIWLCTLFTIGAFLSSLLVELQKHHRVIDCDNNSNVELKGVYHNSSMFSSSRYQEGSHNANKSGSVVLLIGAVCGLSAVVVGAMFPFFDCLLTGKTHRDELGNLFYFILFYFILLYFDLNQQITFFFFFKKKF